VEDILVLAAAVVEQVPLVELEVLQTEQHFLPETLEMEDLEHHPLLLE
jgi:hypothetical protein